jgi:hypothetical protein
MPRGDDDIEMRKMCPIAPRLGPLRAMILLAAFTVGLANFGSLWWLLGRKQPWRDLVVTAVSASEERTNMYTSDVRVALLSAVAEVRKELNDLSRQVVENKAKVNTISASVQAGRCDDHLDAQLNRIELIVKEAFIQGVPQRAPKKKRR